MAQFTDLVYEFPAIATKLENVVVLTKKYISYYKDRASIERDYANGITKTNTQPQKKGVPQPSIVDKVETTLKTMLEKLNTENEKLAQKHLETYTKIMTEIVKPLETLLKDIENGKKKLVNDTNKSIHAHQSLVAASEKAKLNYKKAVTEHKNAVEASKGLEGPALDKANVKVAQLDAKVKKLEGDYRAAVDKANTAKEVLYTTELPEVLKGCQELINKHFEGFKAAIEIYVNNHNELSTVIAGTAEEIRQALEQISFEKDLEEFVNDNNGKHIVNNVELELEGEHKNEPVEEKKEETPVEEKKDETPVEQPANDSNPFGEEKKEETPAEQPVEEKKDDSNPFGDDLN